MDVHDALRHFRRRFGHAFSAELLYWLNLNNRAWKSLNGILAFTTFSFVYCFVSYAFFAHAFFFYIIIASVSWISNKVWEAISDPRQCFRHCFQIRVPSTISGTVNKHKALVSDMILLGLPVVAWVFFFFLIKNKNKKRSKWFIELDLITLYSINYIMANNTGWYCTDMISETVSSNT
jgi:hypothetical protein